MHVWIDGRLLPDPTAAALPVTDHGITVGDGVFESLKVVGGRVVGLTLHLERLNRSATGLGLAPVDPAYVRGGIAAVLAEEHLPLGRLRVTYTAGPGPMGSGRGDAAPTLIVVADQMAPIPPSARVVTVPWSRNEHGALAGLKTTSYAENVIALAYAKERGAGEAVFANTAGDLCEGTGSNVFYVVDDELRTPTLASGCLAGVTRRLVLDWVGAREVDEPIEVVRRASEVFLASTGRDVQAVSHWDDVELPAPGPVTAAAMKVWAEREPEVLETPDWESGASVR